LFKPLEGRFWAYFNK